MNKYRTITVDVPDAVKTMDVTFKVKLIGARSLSVRMWIAKWLIGLGVWLSDRHEIHSLPLRRQSFVPMAFQRRFPRHDRRIKETG